MRQAILQKRAEVQKRWLFVLAIFSFCSLTIYLFASPAQVPAYAFTDLGNLGSPGNTVTQAIGINDQGQVLCSAGVRIAGKDCDQDGHLLDDDHLPQYGFLWQAGKVHALGITNPVCFNNVGQVVCTPTSRETYIWDNGHVREWVDAESKDFSLTGTVSMMNDALEIVGGQDDHAFLWKESPQVDPKVQGKKKINLGTLGGDYSNACGVNNRGQVVGESSTKDDIRHAFLWQKGQMVSLGDLFPKFPERVGIARAINDRG